MVPLLINSLKGFFSTAKKIFIVIVVFVAVISLFSFFISKDKAALRSRVNPIQRNRNEIYKIINDKKLNSTKEGKLTIALYKMSMCGLIGEACTDKPEDGNKNFEKSTFGFMSKLIAFPFMNPPSSGVYWAYSGLQSAGFIPKSYAAEGIGFAAIKPFSNLWKIFRDLAYMLLVLVLIVIGFMIMFRMKINQQTIISVENALPKIVVSLILITFSFPIAGFLIDLMYIVIALVISLLSANNVYFDAGKITNEFIGSNMGTLWNVIVGQPEVTKIGSSILSLAGVWINIFIRTVVGVVSIWALPAGAKLLIEGIQWTFKLFGFSGLGNSLGEVVPSIATLPTNILFMVFAIIIGFLWVPQIIIGFLILFTLVFLFFRLFFYLFSTYVRILLLIIFSPILLLFEAIPGRSVFSWWIKSLLVDIMTFPLMIVLILVASVIQSQPASGVNLWAPPFLGSIDPNVFTILFGITIILMIPELTKLVRETLGVKDLPIGFNIGTFFAGAGAAVAGGTGLVGQFGSLMLGAQYIPGIKKALPKLFPPQGESAGATLEEVLRRNKIISEKGAPELTETSKG